jgi:thiol:disulfide interchange protein DsbC
VVIKQGSGARKLAVFVDPNCGYCKRFERDLATVKDVTIYTFLYPILGPIRTPSRATSGAPRTPPRPGAPGCSTARPGQGDGRCDTAALDRNVEFGKQAPRAGHAGAVLRGRHAQARAR